MANDFGKLIRQRREELRLTLEAVSAPIGITIQHLSMVERGLRRPPQHARLNDLARTLQLDPWQLKIAAADERGVYTLEPLSTAHVRSGRALMRHWPRLTQEQLTAVLQIIEGP